MRTMTGKSTGLKGIIILMFVYCIYISCSDPTNQISQEEHDEIYELQVRDMVYKKPFENHHIGIYNTKTALKILEVSSQLI